jgi:hypothetical protein
MGSCAFAAPDALASVAAVVGPSIVADLLQLQALVVQSDYDTVGLDPDLGWMLTTDVEAAFETGVEVEMESEDG